MTTSTPLHSSLQAVLQSSEETAKLHQEYTTNAPYSHIVLEPLCKPSFMADVHRELTENIKADFKETDLFKVFQTPELGSLEETELQTNMPSLLQLRHMLYSDQFRSMIERIAGCQTLIDRVDCSANAYANSCHLLCHDDVIGTRCVSYIIYLSDPDDAWQAHEGGSLELYPLIEESAVQGEPQAIPSKTILPVFNSMLIFTVQPGRSYHSVQEVFCKHRPRLSISGWYHAATAPTGAQHASLQQILGNTMQESSTSISELSPAFLPLIQHVSATKQANETDKSKKMKPKGLKTTKEIFGLTPADIHELSQFISPSYLKKESIADIRQCFIDDSSVQLQDFLQPQWITSLLPHLIQADKCDNLGKSRASLDYSVGLTENWLIVGPPHKQRYCRYLPTSSTALPATAQTHQDKAGEQLTTIGNFLKSSLFSKFITALTTLEAQGQRQEIRRFRPGLDYTVAHIVQLTKERHLDATLCFVNDDRESEQQILSTAADNEAGTDQHSDSKKRKAQAQEPAASIQSSAAAKKAKKQEGADFNAADNQEADEEDEDEEPEGYAQHWADGDVGGFECFIAAENDAEHAEAAEVYRGDLEQEESTLLSVSAGCNALSLVLRDRGIMKFVKYVSANAPGSRWDITTEYELPPDDSDEEDEDGSGNSSEDDVEDED